MSASVHGTPAQLHAVKEAELDALLAELSRAATALAAIPADHLARMAADRQGRELLEQGVTTLRHQARVLAAVANASQAAAEHVDKALGPSTGRLLA